LAKTKPSSTKTPPGQKGPGQKPAKGVGSATASNIRQKAERRKAK